MVVESAVKSAIGVQLGWVQRALWIYPMEGILEDITPIRKEMVYHRIKVICQNNFVLI